MEAVLKLFAMGPATYAADPWNNFDFVIVSISIIELIMDSSIERTGASGLRTLRLVSNLLSCVEITTGATKI